MDLSSFEDELLKEDFDPITFLNGVFTSEESLEFLPSIIEQVDTRIDSIDDVIRKTIRDFSEPKLRPEGIIEDTVKAVDMFEQKISSLQEQAEHTEAVVAKVCGSIKSYDNAKNNLSNSITCLKRLQMAQSAIEDLEIMAQQLNYGECGERILALSTLLEYFGTFEDNEILKDVKDRFERVKKHLKSVVLTDIQKKLFDKVDPSIAPACNMIEAIGDGFKSDIIDLFCTRYLEAYDKQFKSTPLKEIDRRYNFLKQVIEIFKQDYQKIFPTSWQMSYQISKAFCIQTKIHLKAILQRNKPSVSEFKFAFEQTASIEKVLAEAFPTKVVKPDGEIEWKKADEFIGIIGTAFANYVDLYIEGEVSTLNKFIGKAKEQAKKSSCVDRDLKLLKTGSTLVQYMRSSIDKCAGFSVGSALYDLFFVLKQAMLDYVRGIFEVRPASLKSEAAIMVSAAMANTAFYFMSIVDGLEKRIKESITDQVQLEGIRIDDVKDELGGQTMKMLSWIADGIVGEQLRPGLEALQGGQWMSAGPDTPRFAAAICSGIDSSVPAVLRWLSDDTVSPFRTAFMTRFCRAYSDAAFGANRLTEVGQNRLAAATDVIEKKVLDVFGTAPGSIQERVVKDMLGQVRSSIIVINAPPKAMVSTYMALKKEHSREDFIMHTKAKGLSQPELSKLAEEYEQFGKKRRSKK